MYSNKPNTYYTRLVRLITFAYYAFNFQPTKKVVALVTQLIYLISNLSTNRSNELKSNFHSHFWYIEDPKRV